MKTLNRKKPIGLYCLFVMAALVLIVPAIASISPTELTATLRPCESITETKTVHVEEMPPKVDVVFAFDLTGSMSGIIATAKTKAALIIAQLNTLGIDIQYGVMSYMDYDGYYDSCGYNGQYGSAAHGDYPYSLDQSVTSDSAAVVAAINALSLGWGADGPQDYTRIFYESYADPAVGWRTGAKRILVNFGDNVPHDCNLNEGVTSGTWSTGRDPGRNAVVDGYPPAGDDLKLLDVLQGMSDNGVTLLECHTSSYASAHWDYWTGITGGDVYITSSGTLVADVVDAVEDALVTPMVYGLHLEASSGFELWLDPPVSPPSYPEVVPCNTVEFTVTIHVPLGTDAGEYVVAP